MSKLAEIIAQDMGNRGAMCFERFMELALYCPVYGYYEKETDTAGRKGDFFTSVSVGNLFGQLLAWQFAEWLTEGGNQDTAVEEFPCRLAEAGAHDGRLAADILTWFRQWRPDIFKGLEYAIIEPSASRQMRQARTLAEFSGRVRWVAAPNELLCGTRVLFANELLDAFPVHRVGWDAGARTWFEWGVALERERFVWTRMPLPRALAETSPLPLAHELAEVLPDGFTTEICPQAGNWWREAAVTLAGGKLVTMDYGFAAEELLAPHRSGGTLRAYHRHHLASDPLALPGDQDLTAHVNFSAIRSAGEAAGLATEAFVTQGKFLTGIAERVWSEPGKFEKWTVAHTRQFQTLTHPEHLGRAFQVLVQSRS